jgi:hypothetical protein
VWTRKGYSVGQSLSSYCCKFTFYLKIKKNKIK